MKAKAYISTQNSQSRSIFIRISFRAFVPTEPEEVVDENGNKYVRYSNSKKYKPIEYYTGLTVLLKNWDRKNGRVKNDSYVNGQIQKGIVRMGRIYDALSFDQKLTFDNLKKAIREDETLREIFNRERIVVEREYVPPFEFIEKYIEKAPISKGTQVDLTNTLGHLKAFDEYRKRDFSWKSADYDYYLGLVAYLKTQNLKASTIDKIVKNLKTFLWQADLRDELDVSQDFKKKVGNQSLFRKLDKEETEHVYLTEEEIAQITLADMEDKRLSEIRDLFVIGCWTGLRVSDLSRLQKGNIKNGLLSITPVKTKDTVIIPVTEELQAVLDKYPEQLPKIPTDQHYNREIKKVAKAAKIDEMVMSEIKVGSLRTVAPVPKHELITSHTSRRSFATNLYRRGIPSTQLMFLTGHKTEDAFLRYIKVSKEDNAMDVAKKLNSKIRKIG